MPTPPEILSTATAIANQWRWLAVLWHVVLGACLVALALGWRPSKRLAGTLFTPVLLSVGALAWWSGNPFTGVIFLLLPAALVLLSARVPTERINIGARWVAGPGAALVAFGWVYPHFLNTASWVPYLYAAPLGLVPCPTLAAAMGLALVVDGLNSRPWTLVLAAVGLLYGGIGVFTLGVTIDVALLLGAILLIALALITHRRRHQLTQTVMGPPCRRQSQAACVSLPHPFDNHRHRPANGVADR